MDTQTVWVRDDSEGYIKGRISEIGGGNEFEVQPLKPNEPKRICSVDDIFPACDGEQDHDDNCESLNCLILFLLRPYSSPSRFPPGELMFLNEATLLDNLKTRYFKDKIYVSETIDKTVAFVFIAPFVHFPFVCIDLRGQHSDCGESVQGDPHPLRCQHD